MKRLLLKFKDAAQVSEFVKLVSKLSCDADLCYGSCIVDAKSLMGVMSLAVARSVELVLHSEDCSDEVFEHLKAYAA